MIVKNAPKGNNTTGLLAYLYGPGKGVERGGTEHVDPRTIASWDGLPELHMPVPRSSGGQSVRDMARTVDLPARLAGLSKSGRTGHIVVANRHDDPVLTDEQWRQVAEATMRRAGLWNGPDDAAAVRWIATRHDDNSIHITYCRVREDGRPVGFINYTTAWEAMRHDFERRWQLTPTGTADGTSRRPYGQAEASRAKAERHRPDGDRDAMPDTAQLRHWCTVVALEAESEDAFVSRLRAAGVTVDETRDPTGVVTDYRVGMRTDKHGSPVLYNLAKLAPELELGHLRDQWASNAGTTSTATPLTELAVTTAEQAAAAAPTNPTDAEAAPIAHATRDLLHAAAAYADLPEVRAAAEAADRATRLAGYAPTVPPIAGGPAAQMARDLRVTAGILLQASNASDQPDRDTAVRVILAVASVLAQLEAWHELAERRAAAHAALTAREHLLAARQTLTSRHQTTPITGPVTARSGRAVAATTIPPASYRPPALPPEDHRRR